MFFRSIIVSIFLLPTLVWSADQTVTVAIRGMTCPLCVAAVNKALRSTPGVMTAKTYLGREQAEVIVPTGFDVRRLLASLEEAGYTGDVVSLDNNAQSDVNYSNR